MTFANAISPSALRQMDDLMVSLAREIAMGMHELGTILQNYKVDADEWEKIRCHPRFVSVLDAEMEAWNSASNAAERLKVKSATLLEDWLLEANTQLYNEKNALNHKVDLAKLIASMAGVGITARAGAAEASGGRVSITINMGSNKPLPIRDITPDVTMAVTDEDEE